jgi:succinate dehydrogenase/fumarate reductase-like Fe-S protein
MPKCFRCSEVKHKKKAIKWKNGVCNKCEKRKRQNKNPKYLRKEKRKAQEQVIRQWAKEYQIYPSDNLLIACSNLIRCIDECPAGLN